MSIYKQTNSILIILHNKSTVDGRVLDTDEIDIVYVINFQITPDTDIWTHNTYLTRVCIQYKTHCPILITSIWISLGQTNSCHLPLTNCSKRPQFKVLLAPGSLCWKWTLKVLPNYSDFLANGAYQNLYMSVSVSTPGWVVEKSVIPGDSTLLVLITVRHKQYS